MSAGTDVVFLRSAQDVRETLGSGASLRRLFVAIDIPAVPPDLARRWESRLNLSFRECGCSLGAAFAIAAFLAAIGWQWVGPARPAWVACAVRAGLTAFAAGGAGKLLGVALARLRIRRIADQLVAFAGRPGSTAGECDDVVVHEVGG